MKNTEIFGNNRIDICEQAISFDGLLFLKLQKGKRVDKDEKNFEGTKIEFVQGCLHLFSVRLQC